MPSDIAMSDSSELRVTATRDGHGCRAGDTGRYRWSLSPDGVFLTLELLEDQCTGRGTLFARTWARDLAGPSTGGTGVVHAFDPPFMVTLPKGTFVAGEKVSDAIEVDSPETVRFTAFKNVDGFRDPCNPDDRLDLAPGVDALVAYLQQSEAFSAVTARETTLDGHRAVRMRVTARATGCEGGFLAIWAPPAEAAPFSVNLDPGVADELLVVEVDGSTLLFEVLPGDHPAAASILESIRFLDDLPTGP